MNKTSSTEMIRAHVGTDYEKVLRHMWTKGVQSIGDTIQSIYDSISNKLPAATSAHILDAYVTINQLFMIGTAFLNVDTDSYILPKKDQTEIITATLPTNIGRIHSRCARLDPSKHDTDVPAWTHTMKYIQTVLMHYNGDIASELQYGNLRYLIDEINGDNRGQRAGMTTTTSLIKYVV